MMLALLTGVGWIVYYILRLAYIETREGTTTVTYPIIGTVVTDSGGADDISGSSISAGGEPREIYVVS